MVKIYMKNTYPEINIIGAGLAGCEAAWKLACADVKVNLYEMKPQKYTPAHTYHGYAELVCSNSLKAMRLGSAAGLLKEEMRILGSLILECAEKCAVPAGGALAVDRNLFSDMITEKITSHPNINIISEEVKGLDNFIEKEEVKNLNEFIEKENPDEHSHKTYTIITAGPLCSEPLAESIKEICGENLSFYDAVSPIISAESINFNHAFYAARYDRGDADYINCPMDKNEYEVFTNALSNAKTVELRDFEKDNKVYEGCMPIEVMAKRGFDSLRFGPMRPVGIIDPKTDRRPWAVVQLRKENTAGEMYNLVGFQTNLTWAEQKRVFSLIPALENADFTRYGVMHRNTFIDSPKLLDKHLRLKTHPNIFFAGQITGAEGYTESAATGIYAGINLTRLVKGQPLLTLPDNTMLGEIVNYLCRENKNFQPMGANMGLISSNGIREKNKLKRYEMIAEKSLEIFKKFESEK